MRLLNDFEQSAEDKNGGQNKQEVFMGGGRWTRAYVESPGLR
jgi:hypothetical protein